MITKQFYRLAAVFFLMCIQSILYAQEHSNIRIAPFFDEDTRHLTLTWAPVNDSLWAYGTKYGYSIWRKEAESPFQLIAGNILPKPRSWFESNRNEDKGFLELIEEVFFTPTLNMPDPDDGFSVQAWQYHYLVPEAIKSPLIASALGLSFTDVTYIVGKAYTYTVAVQDSLGNTHQSEIYISEDIEEIFMHQHDLEDMEFSPPNGMSLFDMRGDLPEFTRIETIAKPLGDSIVLRWAPNNEVLWSKAKNQTYAVFRKEYQIISADSTWNDYVFLDSIVPWTLDKFTIESVGQDSMMLIAAQAMYGEQESQETDGILMQHAESAMRYGMAMLSADRSARAAEALGLRYVDKSVEPDKVYTYLIMNRAVENFIENGYIEVFNRINDTFQVQGFFAQPNDHYIDLVWSGLNRNSYSGYLLFRSDDGGKTINKINNAPLLFIDNEYSREDGNFVYQDSIPANYQNYTYYIRGIDAFGDTSQAISLITYGVDKTPPQMPLVYFAEANEEGQITLKWEINNEQEDLDRFHILISSSVDGTYETIAPDLPENTRTYVHKRIREDQYAYYFILIAQDTAGNQQPTMPVFVQLVDSIPPLRPTNLEGIIDSTGRATITWQHGLESDLVGYKVYMGNHQTHEFSQLTVEPTPLNFWQDTITLLALDKHVYYKVVAVDKSNNHSDFSEILTLKRPDILPPSAPATLPASADEKGVKVNWSLSPSNDVVAYIIYRRDVNKGDSVHTRIARVQSKLVTEWLDTTAVFENIYEYVVRAQDQSGLISEPSFPVKGRRVFDFNVLQINYFEARYSKQYNATYVQWRHHLHATLPGQQNNYFFYLYRKKEGGSWKKLKQLASSALTHLDRDFQDEGNYIYGIKIVLADGKAGPMMESEMVEYVKN